MEHFQKYYRNKLCSRDMCNINELKYVINNSKHFQHYFNNVSI